MRAVRLGITVCLLVVLVVLVGCGADRLSSSQYRERVQAIWSDVGSEFLKQQMAISRAPDATLAVSRVEALQRALRDGADRLDSLAPPEDAEAPNGDLVDALRDLADDLDRYKKRDEKSLRPLSTFASDVGALESTRKLRRAAAALEARGYPLEER